MMAIVQPSGTQPIVEQDGTMSNAFRLWTTEVTRLDLIIGTGSPEGVVSAIQGREYMDDAGTAGSIKYIKRDASVSGDDTSGWFLV